MNRYSVIYADPPWAYDDKRPRGGAEHHYRTLSLDDLAALQVDGRPVADLAAPDCALFMWATWPMLREALVLMRAWGFTYKTCAFAWVKTNAKAGTPFVGLGRYTRGNTEVCLLGVRGKPQRVDAGVPQVLLETMAEEPLLAPRGAHSAKPPEARERIVRLMGDVSRIELFARERAAGWAAWGNELPAERVQIPDSTEAA